MPAEERLAAQRFDLVEVRRWVRYSPPWLTALVDAVEATLQRDAAEAACARAWVAARSHPPGSPERDAAYAADDAYREAKLRYSEALGRFDAP